MDDHLPADLVSRWAALNLREGLTDIHWLGIGCAVLIGSIAYWHGDGGIALAWALTLTVAHLAVLGVVRLTHDGYTSHPAYRISHLVGAGAWGLAPLLFINDLALGYREMFAVLLVALGLVIQAPLSYSPRLCLSVLALLFLPPVLTYLPEIIARPWSMQLAQSGFLVATLALLSSRTLKIHGFYARRAEAALEERQARQEMNENRRALRRAEQAIERFREWDDVTGIMSQHGFFHGLSPTAPREAVALCLKLKGFKYLNTAFGHEVGNDVLKEVASRLSALAGGAEHVCRSGGGQFVAFLTEPPADLILRLETMMEKPCLTRQGRLPIKGYWGIGAMSGVEHPLDAIDMAMNAATRAKAENLSEPVLLEASSIDAQRARSSLQFEIGDAVKRNEFHLVYQPQFRAADGGVEGYEVLLRWRSSVFGDVSPADFIPVAEESGQIIELGAWVLDQALDEMAQTVLEQALFLSVNVALPQLEDPDFIDLVRATLRKHDFPAERLVLELTEGSFMKRPLVIREKLDALRALGVKTSLDDFGTGYSSLAWLTQLPIDHLKIDRSLIRDIATDDLSRKLVAMVLDLCDTAGLKACVEGIETQEQMDVLGRRRNVIYQGFLFARPMPLAEALAMAERKLLRLVGGRDLSTS